MAEVKKNGKHVQGTMSYTLDLFMIFNISWTLVKTGDAGQTHLYQGYGED